MRQYSTNVNAAIHGEDKSSSVNIKDPKVGNKKVVVVNQENDIAQIIDGLKKIMMQCLAIKIGNSSAEDLPEKPVQT